jgi:hypothetical protein
MKGFKSVKCLLITCLFIVICATISKAQYPFEKYKEIKYKRITFNQSYNKDSSIVYYYAKLSSPNKGKSIKSILFFGNEIDTMLTILIKKNEEIIQTISVHGDFPLRNMDDYIYVGDINGDGLADMKISFNNMSGAGLAGSLEKRMYLFQRKNGQYRMISFSDFAVDYSHHKLNNSWIDWPERDFNNDRNFEIITCRLTRYRNHSYWTFDLYNYVNGELVCVDDKYDYPKMFQYLEARDNYDVTKKISPEKMKTFKAKKPDEYDIR